MRLYLDANSIIYSIEGVPVFRQASLDWIERAEAADGVVITSRLSGSNAGYGPCERPK